jgi:sulfur relay (sulfurtransferase) complex TusBCD TusD component (DsrE family)
MADLRNKKLGILLAAVPDQPNFSHAIALAESALRKGLLVYLYCIDEAVRGIADARLQDLKNRGVNLFACAYSAQQRQIPVTEEAAFAGLTVVSDLIAASDRFISFN